MGGLPRPPQKKFPFQEVVSLLALDLVSSGVHIEPTTLQVVGKRVVFTFPVLGKYDLHLKMDEIAKDLLDNPKHDDTNKNCVTSLQAFTDALPFDVASCMPRKHRYDKPYDVSAPPAPSNKPYKHKIAVENRSGTNGPANINELNEDPQTD